MIAFTTDTLVWLLIGWFRDPFYNALNHFFVLFAAVIWLLFNTNLIDATLHKYVITKIWTEPIPIDQSNFAIQLDRCLFNWCVCEVRVEISTTIALSVYFFLNIYCRI